MGELGTRIIRDELTGGRWHDPVCQSFLVDNTNGILFQVLRFSLKLNQVAYLLPYR